MRRKTTARESTTTFFTLSHGRCAVPARSTAAAIKHSRLKLCPLTSLCVTCSNNHSVPTSKKRFSATNASLLHRSRSCLWIFNWPITTNQQGNQWIPSLIRHILSHSLSFDRTEFEGNLTPSNAAHLPPIPSGSPVLFRGVLSLHALAHLSEEGQKHLKHDFKERVTRSAVNGVLGPRKHTNTNLEVIFALKAKQRNVPEAEKYNIRVLIQGHMHSTASFMRCTSVVPCFRR